MKNNILKTFEIFWREPLSILREGFIRLVNVQTNIFAQKPSVNIDLSDKRPQITVVNSDNMYGLLKTVLYKKKMLENSGEIVKR